MKLLGRIILTGFVIGALVGFAIFYSAYIGELMRAGDQQLNLVQTAEESNALHVGVILFSVILVGGVAWNAELIFGNKHKHRHALKKK